MAAAARIDVKLNVGKPGRRFVNALFPWLVLCVSTIALAIAGKHGILQPLVVYPDHWVAPIEPVITNAIDWLVHDASFGLFTFHQLTRAMSGVVAVPLDVLAVILATGSQFSVAGLVIHVPHISWLGSLIATAILGLRYGGLRLALLLSGCVLYTAVFGQWDSAMVTLASVAISVPLGVIGGLLLGIAAYRRVLVGRMIRPCLDRKSVV